MRYMAKLNKEVSYSQEKITNKPWGLCVEDDEDKRGVPPPYYGGKIKIG
jgi:hypothetical protein